MTTESTAPAIALEAVSKRVLDGERERAAVQEIDLEIARGELVALAGPSGSGKTTLLALMGAMTTPTEGAIRLLGEDVVTLRDHHRARFRAAHVGFVFQDLGLIDRMTLIENVLLPMLPRGVPLAPSRERAHTLLDELGLADRADTVAGHLSGGERQRGAIVRALLPSPEVLLMDEPTAHVDRESAGRILESLGALRDEGHTVVLATHDPRVLERPEVDRVVTLRDGRLAPGR